MKLALTIAVLPIERVNKLRNVDEKELAKLFSLRKTLNGAEGDPPVGKTSNSTGRPEKSDETSNQADGWAAPFKLLMMAQ